MDNATIVDIMLGVLAAAVGFAGFLSSGRANKVQAVGIQTEVETDAFAKARGIYEGAIEQLKDQVARFREEVTTLRGEVTLLRQANAELQEYNRELMGQLNELRGLNAELRDELRRSREELAALRRT